MRAVPFAINVVAPLTFAALAALEGCGGEPKVAATPAGTAADAGAKTAPPAQPFIASNVPMASVPPSFQYGSRKAEMKPLTGPNPCRADFGPQAPASSGADLAGQVQKLAKSCSEKMRALAAPTSGTQTQGAPAQNVKLKAESGRCYRVFATAASTVKNLIVVVTDSTGAIAWEARTEEPRLVAPEDGTLCFKANDDAQVTVSVGSGDGAYALQIVSD